MSIFYPTSFWIGIGINIFGALFGAVGDTLVRRAHITHKQCGAETHFFKSPIWWAGIIFSALINPLCTVFSLYYIPLALVTSFAGLHIVFVILISRMWLKETVTFIECFGASLEILGIFILVQSSCSRQFDELLIVMQYFFKPSSISYAVLTSLFIFASSILLTRQMRTLKYTRLISDFAIPISCGFTGGFSNLFTKAVTIGFSKMTRRQLSIEENNFYIFISFGAILTVMYQGFLWNMSLKNGVAGVVVPIINSSLIVSGAIISILFYEEYPITYSQFNFGITVILLGFFFIFISKKNNHVIYEGLDGDYRLLERLPGDTRDHNAHSENL